jgi:hypothetical protein
MVLFFWMRYLQQSSNNIVKWGCTCGSSQKDGNRYADLFTKDVIMILCRFPKIRRLVSC